MRSIMLGLALVLAAAASASTASAQIVCDLCEEMQPGWEGFVVTTERSAADCAKVGRPAGEGAPWRRDPRRVAAVSFGRLPAERGDDPKAGAILQQMTVVLQTDTDAIVLGRVGETERRVCLVRAGADDPWVVVRLDVADLSKPAPAAKP